MTGNGFRGIACLTSRPRTLQDAASMFRILAALIFSLACFAAPEGAAAPPNVILILADDMALGDLGSLNGGISRTPNLDRLREESVHFVNARSASPVCAPARAALLTGRYPHRTGAVTLNMEKYPELSRIRKDETTMADVFRAGGYATGMIGKWHSGAGPEFHPLSRGFDEFEGFIGHLYVPSYFNFKLDIQRETKAFPGRYLTTELSERAIEFVRRHRDEPFFLHLAHYAPHRPIEAPEERIAPFVEAGLSREIATVYAMIEVMDEGIGDLLEELEALDLAERTLVFFASDNGPDPLVETRFNLALRGSKYEVHEGGIRVPFFVRWSGEFEPAERDDPVHFTDVLPTLAEICGLEGTDGLAIDGTGFAPALRGEPVEYPERRFWQWNRREPLYSHNAAVQDGKWKLVRPFVTKNLPKGPSDSPPMLFDLVADPGEQVDVSADFPERVERMNSELARWCEEVERDRTRKSDEPK